jgi:hypothetical protein
MLFRFPPRPVSKPDARRFGYPRPGFAALLPGDLAAVWLNETLSTEF